MCDWFPSNNRDRPISIPSVLSRASLVLLFVVASSSNQLPPTESSKPRIPTFGSPDPRPRRPAGIHSDSPIATQGDVRRAGEASGYVVAPVWDIDYVGRRAPPVWEKAPTVARSFLQCLDTQTSIPLRSHGRIMFSSGAFTRPPVIPCLVVLGPRPLLCTKVQSWAPQLFQGDYRVGERAMDLSDWLIGPRSLGHGT